MCGAEPTPGPSPIRRLNRFEYDNTIRDLLGDDSRPARGFPPEEEALGFNNNAGALGVTQLLAEQYMVAAEGIAARAVAGGLPELLGCDPAADEAGCVRSFIERFGGRAFRRPLAASETDELVALFGATREAYDVATGIEVVMQGVLQSPHFLYRVEVDGEPVGDDVVALDGYQIASRLSYFLWSTMPDQALFDAAAAGGLDTADGIADQARRMLADPRSHATVRDFHAQWLKLDGLGAASKDPEVFPGFDDEVRGALREETLAFVDDVIWNGEGTVEALLTAPYTMMDATLAAFYGVEGPSGDAFERVELGGEHAGLLSQGALLASLAKADQTSPVLRGKFVREQLLCQTLAPPPPDVDVTPPDVSADLSTRERFEQHRTDPVCAGCHRAMDPIGFGFEKFDGSGRYRAEENGLPIDDSGEIFDSLDADGAFTGVAGLAARLAGSSQAQGCVTTQWFRYAYGRGERAADACTIEKVSTYVGERGGDVQTLLVALTQTDAFRYRTAEGGL